MSPIRPPVTCDYPACGADASAGARYCHAHAIKPVSDTPALPPTKPLWWRWYQTAHWRNLRKLVLHRCPVCAACGREGATVADHIIPHKGSWALFCDLKNLHGLCKSCHDSKTAKEDGGFGNPIGVQLPDDTFAPPSMGTARLDDALKDVDKLLEGL